MSSSSAPSKPAPDAERPGRLHPDREAFEIGALRIGEAGEIGLVPRLASSHSRTPRRRSTSVASTRDDPEMQRSPIVRSLLPSLTGLSGEGLHASRRAGKRLVALSVPAFATRGGAMKIVAADIGGTHARFALAELGRASAPDRRDAQISDARALPGWPPPGRGSRGTAAAPCPAPPPSPSPRRSRATR